MRIKEYNQLIRQKHMHMVCKDIVCKKEEIKCKDIVCKKEEIKCNITIKQYKNV